MTTSPVSPAAAKGLIISPTSDFCNGLIKLMLQLPVQFYKLINYMFNADGTINNLFLQQISPPGTYLFTASNVTPPGYLLCNGAIKNRADYPDLFVAIGTIYGDGNSDDLTFTLPDYQGRFPVGVGTTQGLKDRAGADLAGTTYGLGGTGGEEKEVLLVAEMPCHRHQNFSPGTETANRTLTSVETVVERGAYSSEPSYNMNRVADGDLTAPTVGPSSLVGGDPSQQLTSPGNCSGHNNIPPFLAAFIFVKT